MFSDFVGGSRERNKISPIAKVFTDFCQSDEKTSIVSGLTLLRPQSIRLSVLSSNISQSHHTALRYVVLSPI